jgi:hypothetical protein
MPASLRPLIQQQPLEKVKHEWALVCTAHNLTKLARAAAA